MFIRIFRLQNWWRERSYYFYIKWTKLRYTNFHQNTTLSLVNFHVQVLISVSLNKISLKYHPIYHDSSPEIATIIYMSKKLNFNKINLHSFFTVLYNCRSLTVKVSNIVLLFLICMLQSLNRKKHMPVKFILRAF